MKELTKEELKIKVLKQEKEISLLKELSQLLTKMVNLLEVQNKLLWKIVDRHEIKIKEYESKNRRSKKRNEN